MAITRLGELLFKHRNAAFPLAFLLVFMPGPRILRDPLHAAGIGFAVALLGQALRATTVGLEYIVRGGRNRRVHAEGLVVAGLYAHCRNPMYVGNLLILIGVALVSNSWGCVATAVPLFTCIYAAIVATEEAYLREKFGTAFASYQAATPRWVPRMRGLRATFAASRFRWRRMLSKEYGTPFGWLMGMFVLVLWNLWRAEQWSLRTAAVHTLFGGMLGTLVLWMVIRSMKKSGVLVAD